VLIDIISTGIVFQIAAFIQTMMLSGIY